MRHFLITLFLSFFCLFIGLAVGIFWGPQVKETQPARCVMSFASKTPLAKLIGQPDDNSPFEMYNYPTIKWRAKPLADAPGAIAQLWTTYEVPDAQHPSGRVNYRLTVFKVPDKPREVQLLDGSGFKLTQFDASDFHPVAGASDIMEARDSHDCTEAEYKRVGDYSIK